MRALSRGFLVACTVVVFATLVRGAAVADEFAGLQALQAERAERAKAGGTYTPTEQARWTSDYADRLGEAALAAYEKNPADPRRWEAALVALQTLRGFVVEYKPGYDEAIAARDVPRIQSFIVRDESARAAWEARLDALQTALFAAPDVAPAVLGDAYANAVYRVSLRRGATPAQRWAAMQPLLEAMERRITEPAKLTRALELSARTLLAADPVAYDEFLRVRSQSPITEVARWATGKANVRTAKVQAVDMKFTALDGRVVDVAALRGKVVLIDFWATWCGPCKEELPNIVANYRKYHALGFEVVGVSLDSEKDRQKLADYVREKELPWPQHFDGNGWKNEFAVKFGIRAVPAMFLLDQDGKVVTTEARGTKLETEIRRLLKLDAAATTGTEPTRATQDLSPAVAPENPPTPLLGAGAMAPDFRSVDFTGREVRLSDYRGKVVILDFWATWCGPCIASMPHTQEIAAKYADQGVVVLAVCTGDKRKRFDDWVKLKGAAYPALRFTFDPHEQGTPGHEQRASFALYGVPSIPTQFIIGRDGRIAGVTSGYMPGDNSLEKLLAVAGVKVDSALLAAPSRLAEARAATAASAPADAPATPAVARRTAPPFVEKVAKLAAGDVVTDVDFRTADGAPQKLSAFRGKPLILFFSTAEMIADDFLDGLAEKYGAAGVQVLALVTRDTEANFAAWRTLHAPRRHKFTVAFDPVPVAEARNGVINRIFQFGAPTPFSIVIDAEGKFVGSFPWKLPQGQAGLAELLRRSGVAVAVIEPAPASPAK